MASHDPTPNSSLTSDVTGNQDGRGPEERDAEHGCQDADAGHGHLAPRAQGGDRRRTQVVLGPKLLLAMGCMKLS